MSAPKDGGPAYPTPDCSNWDGPSRTQGMSLRDWFAGQIMAGRCANATLLTNLESEGIPSERLPAILSKQAYLLADAMLAARQPTP